MMRCLLRYSIAQHCPLQAHRNCSYPSATKLVGPLTAGEKRKCTPLNANNIMSTSMAQPRAVPTVNATTTSSTAMPLLETSPEIAAEEFSIPVIKTAVRARVDKTALPFEEIPGPAILKLWEKYWRYVPLFGRLSWNRNIKPMKYLFDEYGCIVRINGPFVNDIVMIHRPEHIAEVLEQENKSPIRSGIDILQHYHLHHRKYRSAGAFSLQSSEWLEVREKVDQPFNNIVCDYFEKLDAVCGEFANRIREICNRQDEVPATFHRDLTAWGMECFYVTMFNKHLGFLDSTSRSVDETTKVINALTTAHTYMSRCETGFQVWRFFETPFTKKLFASCDVLNEIIGKYIRRAQNKLQCLSLPELQESAEENRSSPLLEKMLAQRIHVDDISTLLLDMMILGVQAVVNCEAFLIYFLAKNPRAQKQLYDEIISTTSETRSILTKESLKNMPYLKACVKESLRLRPAFPYLTRLLSSPITLHGYTIPKGTFIIMANQITSQREQLFEDPEKFLPERWLSQDAHNSYQEYSCLPFGYGVRSCLGRNIAETQMTLLIAKLVREFTIEYDYADIRSQYLMVNVPNRPLRFRFVDRK